MSTKRKWIWTSEMEEKFNKLKVMLREMKSLILPNYDKPFLLRIDACNEQIVAVLV